MPVSRLRPSTVKFPRSNALADPLPRMIVILREQDTVFRGRNAHWKTNGRHRGLWCIRCAAMAATGRGAGFGSLSGP